MKAVMLTQGDRIRRLDKTDLEKLRILQRDRERNGSDEKTILAATDKFLKARGIGEYGIK